MHRDPSDQPQRGWRAALRQIPPPKIGINPRPTGLTGLDTWLWYEGPEELQVSTSIGPWTVTGTARVQDVVFEMGEGRTANASRAGSESDPAARYLYSELPKDGSVVLDFNKAYNPPCAFTDYATCPLPPRENHLSARIEAGEKKYH